MDEPTTTVPPGAWYPDPLRRREQRWWDGRQWTEDVMDGGVPDFDPPTPRPYVPVGTSTHDDIRRQVSSVGARQLFPPGDHPFDRPVLAVNQLMTWDGSGVEYALHDGFGPQVAAVRQVDRARNARLVAFFTNLDHHLAHHVQFVDGWGRVLMSVVRPGSGLSTNQVLDSRRRVHGGIRQLKSIGRIDFAIEGAAGHLGTIVGENWSSSSFRIVDAAGTEVARVVKTWEGLVKSSFSNADHYVLLMHHRLDEPMRSLVVASPVVIDLALKQRRR